MTSIAPSGTDAMRRASSTRESALHTALDSVNRRDERVAAVRRRRGGYGVARPTSRRANFGFGVVAAFSQRQKRQKRVDVEQDCSHPAPRRRQARGSGSGERVERDLAGDGVRERVLRHSVRISGREPQPPMPARARVAAKGQVTVLADGHVGSNSFGEGKVYRRRGLRNLRKSRRSRFYTVIPAKEGIQRSGGRSSHRPPTPLRFRTSTDASANINTPYLLPYRA